MGSAKPQAKSNLDEIRLYKRRWLLMVVFLVYVVDLALHWVEFTSITNVVVRYYGVSSVWVEGTTVMFMVFYLAGVFPALYLLDKLGLKSSLLLVTSGIAIGAVVKVFSVSPDRFYILIIGQIFVALSSTFCFSFVGRFMATWFGSKEISRAGAIIMLGDQFGAGLSFLIPSLLVEDSPDTKVIEQGLRRLNIVFAILAIATFILILLLFREKPKIPPSFAQKKQSEAKQDVWKCVVKIFTQKSFILMSLSYSLTLSTHGVLSTFLNEYVESHFKDRAQDAGKIGFTIMFCGMISSLFCGYILDKKRHFRGNAIILSLGGAISVVLFTVSLKLGNIALVYVTAGMVGVCLLGYYATGMQMGIELTYPVPEGIVISSIGFLSQILGVGLIAFHSLVLKPYSVMASVIGLIVNMALSFIFACLVPGDLKREQTEKLGTAAELQEFISRK